MCVGLHWYTEGTTKAKISNFQAEDAVLYKEVLGLKVTVQHSMLVAMSQTLDQLVHEVLGSTSNGCQPIDHEELLHSP
jgi:hypothetical protein